jgi:alkyldihydroxyacetonephosphate synthase
VRSWWGWGNRDSVVDPAGAARLVGPYLPLDGEITPIPGVPELRPPRVTPPSGDIWSDDPWQRAAHTHGKAFRDVVRNLRGELANPPDLVCFPRGEADVVQILEWAYQSGVAVVPFGGGTSVVGGVELRDPDQTFVSLDLTGMDTILEVDEVSLAMRSQAGILGPSIQDGLRPKGLALRHFPQSFEFSTLGGWIATRSGGHFATGPTHIDDFIESLRVITPVGISESLRVPASGAGPSPDRLFLGSEGALGIITEAWVRVQRAPAFRASASVRFEDLGHSVLATREVAQSGLMPSNCRLLDPLEAMLAAGVTDGAAVLLLAFESADHPVEVALERAVEICRGHGGIRLEQRAQASWRDSFLKAPYLRDALARLGVVIETFETACTWSAFPTLHEAVLAAVNPAIVTCRFTHVYPDGPAPYFTVYATARRGAEIETWDELKARASEALLANGGTITHHHAVGRDHVPWYLRQTPQPLRQMLRAAKAAIDPRHLLNPGVLGID